MMDHGDYRKAIMSDPNDPDPKLRAHRETCRECDLYTEELKGFETRLERALRVDLAGATVLPLTRKRAAAPRPWRRMAIAASVLLGLGVAGGVWLALPQPTLAADVVAHMAGEPDAWRRTDVPVADPELDAVLRDSKLSLRSDAGIVSYASSCLFRGHHVPHLVVQTPSGPVTVMVLVHEPVSRSAKFDERGYRGTIVPVPGHGSIAVLMQGSGDGSDVARIAAQVNDAIVWKP
jgi:Protein of unknown function (DUF3379)